MLNIIKNGKKIRKHRKVGKIMSKKALKLGAASILALGAGAAVVSKKNKRNEQRKVTKDIQKRAHEEFRNTERGKYTKNSKGIYYSNGNYEAFARPEKPEGVDDKSAYIVGSGLGALAAACFLVRDGQMKGENIHILEAMDIAGGACDGINDPTEELYMIRGGQRWRITDVCGICSEVFKIY
ncbi:MAG: oleate hydratase [Lachnospira eligens]